MCGGGGGRGGGAGVDPWILEGARRGGWGFRVLEKVGPYRNFIFLEVGGGQPRPL